jgi:hypothetical protein
MPVGPALAPTPQPCAAPRAAPAGHPQPHELQWRGCRELEAGGGLVPELQLMHGGTSPSSASRPPGLQLQWLMYSLTLFGNSKRPPHHAMSTSP